jgi:hypothetical protein
MGWLAFNAAVVLLRHRATREDRKQVVYDIFDGRVVR